MEDLKERLVDEDIHSYAWLPTENMWADILTKEIYILPDLEDVFFKNVIDLPKTAVNEVKAIRTEIRMDTIRNRRTDDV